MAKRHAFKFFRAGGVDQVRLDTGADILAIGELDQKLWVALSCPVSGLEFDKKTLELVDTDNDGRIRAPELIAAVKWVGLVLKDPDSLLLRHDKLGLSEIDTSNEEGKRVHASAKQILKNLGKKDLKEISLEDTLDTVKIFSATKFNGDGIVPPLSADDPALQKTLEDIIACVGSEADRSGAPGVSQALVDAFFADATALGAWWKLADDDAAKLLPLGDATDSAADAFRAVKIKVDDYFTRCKLAAFDARAATALNRDEAEFSKLAGASMNAASSIDFPLAHVEADRALPLERGLNPAWADAIKTLRAEVIKPILGDRSALGADDWAQLTKKLEAHEAWRQNKPPTKLDGLGKARVRELLASEAKTKVDELIAKDKALESEANAIASVEKLVRFHRDLHKLLVNYVSFREFYAREKAIFQAGTLYIDARSCELCIKVADPAAHSVLASLSQACLVYCACTRKGSAETMHIVTTLTDGDSDHVMVGRNAIFYDRDGNDWDATVVKLVDSPISIRQAFWLPYKRVAKLIGQQIHKFASSQDKAAEEAAAKHVESGASTATTPSAAPTQAFDAAKFAGIFAAIGLAIGAIGTALAAILTGFFALTWWQMPFVVLGLMLLISGPSMLIAWLKLRQRSIGPILDAAGWAVNARARINIPFGKSLTKLATLPKGAERSLHDPYADKKPGWILWLLIFVVLGAFAAWRFGYAHILTDALKPPAVTAPAASTK